MKPDGPIKLVSELLDLPLIDSDGKYCGIVDDVELSGGPGKELQAQSVAGRARAPMTAGLPRWAMWLVRIDRRRSHDARAVGRRCARSARAVELECAASEARAAQEREPRRPLDSAKGRAVMRLSDLRDKKIRSLEGETLGRVHEVHCEGRPGRRADVRAREA